MAQSFKSALSAAARDKLLLLAGPFGCLVIFQTAGPQSPAFYQTYLIGSALLCFLGIRSGERLLPATFILLSAVGSAVVGIGGGPDLTEKQAAAYCLGCIAYWLGGNSAVRKSAARAAPWAAAAVVAAQAAAAFAGVETRGARRWLDLGFVQFQPSAFSAAGLALAFAFVGARRPGEKTGALLGAAYAGVCIALHAAQKDLGGALVIFGATALYAAARSGARWVLPAAAAACAGAGGLLFTFVGRVQRRFLAWLDPWGHRWDEGYQIVEGLQALAAGGAAGALKPMAGRVPLAVMDAPLAVWSESTGLIGAAALLGLYAAWIHRHFRYARCPGDGFGSRLALATGCCLLVQVALAAGGVVRLTPITGLAMPLAGLGGTAAVAAMFSTGLACGGRRPPAQGIKTAPSAGGGRRAGPEAFPGLPAVARFGRFAFVLLAAACCYWTMAQGEALARDPTNVRSWLGPGPYGRAGIIDRSGEAIAPSRLPGEPVDRRPPAHLLHPVGYVDRRFGKSGLEAALDEVLSGSARSGPTDVRITLDGALQEAAWTALGDRAGAVVVIEPSSGEILALVSRPYRLPGDEASAGFEEAQHFPRATMGRYPPGSVWKIVVMAAALESGAVRAWDEFHHVQEKRLMGRTVRSGTAQTRPVNLIDALAISSNTVFAELAARIGPEPFARILKPLSTLGALPIGAFHEIPYVPSAGAALVESGFGQGPILVSPLQMAMMTACIANGGVCAAPRLLSEGSGQPEQSRGGMPMGTTRAMSEETARWIQRAMVAAVERGTARPASLGPGWIAGKTGTAETAGGAPHSWFVGFAPADRPRWAVSVLVEHGGSGGSAAAPVGRAVLEAAIRIQAGRRLGGVRP